MKVDVPASALAAGMSNEPAGTHTSRTLMLRELAALLASRGRRASYEDYSTAVVDDNVLTKATLATRKKTLRHLRELYALRPEVPVFAALRELWWADEAGRPLLALLCAVGRDPLLRSTAQVITDAAPGTPVDAADIASAVEQTFPHRFAPGVRARIGRNAASSWTQSAHLLGRDHKARARAVATPATVGYALYLGHLGGDTGSGLFRTLWAQLLDVSESSARELAASASRLGWVTYRSSAGMTEVTFRQLDALNNDLVGEGAE